MISDMECLAVIYSGVVTWSVVCAGRKEIGVVGLPQTDMHIESGCKCRHFHVVSPLAGLAHPLHVLFKLLLQLLLCEVCGVDAGGHGSGGLAFRVSSHVVYGHVLAVEVCIVSHMLDGSRPQDLVHVLVAIELVGQGVEQAVALCGNQPQSEQL